MSDTNTCQVTRLLGDTNLRCELPEDHVTPTDAQPAGQPHQNSEYPDVITGDPYRWWS